MTQLFQPAFRHLACAFMVSFVVIAAVVPTQAFSQTPSEFANCEEVKDPDSVFQAQLCSAHVGCNMVLKVQKTCTRAKQFLTRLKDSIGEGTKGFFGYRKEVTPETIFEASLNDKTETLSKGAETKALAETIRSGVQKAPSDAHPFKDQLGRGAVYYGEMKSGMFDGYGTTVNSDGVVIRGFFATGNLSGARDSVSPNAGRFLGEFENNMPSRGALAATDGRVFSGKFNEGFLQSGKLIRPDGSRFEGTFDKGVRERGEEYLANGRLAEEGRYENNALVVGKRFDSSGTVTEIDIPRDRTMAANAAQETRDRAAREAAAQRLAEEQRTAQAFRDSLGAMSAGQLFAKADELSSAGDKTKAREALRALVAKYPDHQLAVAAAQQMSGTGGGNTASVASSTRPIVATSGGAGKPKTCDEAIRGLRDIGDAERKKMGEYNWRYLFYWGQFKKLVNSYSNCSVNEKKRINDEFDGYQKICIQQRKSCNHPTRDSSCELIMNQDCTIGDRGVDAAAIENYVQQVISGKLPESASSGTSETSGACKAERDALNRRLATAQARIANLKSATENLAAAMWVTQESINVGDRHCQGDSAWPSERAGLKRSYDSAAQSCGQLSGSGSCSPRQP